MALVTGGEILQKARREGFAVGGFNGHNLETVQAIVQAAEEERAPVIIQLSRGSIEYAGLDVAANLIKTSARQSSAPVVLHLDHGMTLELNVRCLRAGFTSLMFDGSEILLKDPDRVVEQGKPGGIVDAVQSRESFEANLSMTRSVVELAHPCGVPVEAELGKVPRLSDFLAAGIRIDDVTRLTPDAIEFTAQLFADPDRAAEFVQESGCDSLAVACGSVHGMTEPVLPLNLDHLEKISSRTGIPLVLHGSSGVLRTRGEADRRRISLARGEGSIEDAVRCGVSKVNVSTELQVTFLEALREELAKHPDITDLRKLFPAVITKLKNRVIDFIRILGSSGKA
jgi:fructose-bisphosphate aldolase class II